VITTSTLYAVCDDGTVWAMPVGGRSWEQLDTSEVTQRRRGRLTWI
jgi:hypothetical protein